MVNNHLFGLVYLKKCRFSVFYPLLVWKFLGNLFFTHSSSMKKCQGKAESLVWLHMFVRKFGQTLAEPKVWSTTTTYIWTSGLLEIGLLAILSFGVLRLCSFWNFKSNALIRTFFCPQKFLSNPPSFPQYWEANGAPGSMYATTYSNYSS